MKNCKNHYIFKNIEQIYVLYPSYKYKINFNDIYDYIDNLLKFAYSSSFPICFIVLALYQLKSQRTPSI